MRYRKHVLALVAAPLLLLACSNGGSDGVAPTAPESVEPELIEVEGEATVEVCHQAQKKIDLRLSKLKHHLEHGDWLIGPEICDGKDNDCDTHIDEGSTCDGMAVGTP